MLRLGQTLGIVAVLATVPAAAQQGDTLWMMWERNAPVCYGANCQQRFTSHFLMNVPPPTAQQLFQGFAPLAAASGSANIAHDELPFCDQPAAPQVGDLAPPTSVDVTGMEPVPAVETLTGLAGVHADFRGLVGPPGYVGNFGSDAHNFFVEKVTEAGIPLLSKEEALASPGQPMLRLSFSVEVRGCKPWSVSLSLSQTLVLSRDLAKMLSGTTWAGSARQDEGNVDFTPINAVEEVVIKFVEAWQTAHRPPEEIAETQ